MNTHAEYRRHAYRQPEQPATTPANEATATELARHGDPSLRSNSAAPDPSQKRIAWVRPTELTSYVGPMVGRGVDLQAELIRRARRTPATTSRAVQQRAHRSPAAERPTARQEGLQL